MPDQTVVSILFAIDAAKAKGDIAEMKAMLASLEQQFAGASAFTKFGAAPEELKKGYWELRDAANGATQATEELGEVTSNTRGIFEVFEGYITRIGFRLVAFEAVMGGVRAAIAEIKNGLDLSKEEAVFKNVVGDAEEAGEAFKTLTLAVGGDAKETAELTKAYNDLASVGTKSGEEVTNETLRLYEVSQVFGSKLTEISKIYREVGESGKITLSELNTLHRDTGHTIDAEVAAWKELDDHINTITQDIAYQKEVYAELNRADDQVIQAQDRVAEKAEQRRDREADAAEKATDREVDAAQKAADREVDIAQKAADRKADAAVKAENQQADDIQSIRDKARSKGQRIGLTGEEIRAQALGQREYALAGVRGTPAEFQREGERVQRQQRQEAEEATRAKREETEATQREQRQQAEEAKRQARQEAEQAAREKRQDDAEDAREARREAREQATDDRRETQRREIASMEQAKEDARQKQQIEGRRAMTAIEQIPGIEAKAAAVKPLAFRLDQESVKDLGSSYKNALKDLEDSNRALVGIFQGT